MLLNVYLICLRCTQGNTINRTIQVGRSVSRRVKLGGAAPDGKIPLPLMTKGREIYQIHDRNAWRESTEACRQGEQPNESSVRGSIPKGRYSLPLMSKGER
jgi:hypothetical protein